MALGRRLMHGVMYNMERLFMFYGRHCIGLLVAVCHVLHGVALGHCFMQCVMYNVAPPFISFGMLCIMVSASQYVMYSMTRPCMQYVLYNVARPFTFSGMHCSRVTAFAVPCTWHGPGQLCM